MAHPLLFTLMPHLTARIVTYCPNSKMCYDQHIFDQENRMLNYALGLNSFYGELFWNKTTAYLHFWSLDIGMAQAVDILLRRRRDVHNLSWS